MEINPVTQQRFVRTPHSGDIVVLSTSGDETLDYEDKVVIGAWTDKRSSGTKSKYSVMFAGVTNNLENTDAAMYGAEDEDRTSRGNDSQLVRSEQKEFYFE